MPLGCGLPNVDGLASNNRPFLRFGADPTDPDTIANHVAKVTVSHPSLSMTTAGATNVRILRLLVESVGNLGTPAAITSFSFGDKGNLPAAISGIKIYHTDDSVFATTLQVGTTLLGATAGQYN